MYAKHTIEAFYTYRKNDQAIIEKTGKIKEVTMNKIKITLTINNTAKTSPNQPENH